MFCPRCGAEVDQDSRYCASCGTELPRKAAASGTEPAGPTGFQEAAGRVLGDSRRARVVTAVTAVAIAIAVVSFIALGSGDDEASLPQDAVAKSLDRACVRHKTEIAAAQRQALSQQSLDAVGRYADSVVRIVGEWRLELGRASVPPDRSALVAALSAALLEAQIEAGTLGRAADESNRREVGVSAAGLDAATAKVESAIDSLELERCGSLDIAQGRLIRE